VVNKRGSPRVRQATSRRGPGRSVLKLDLGAGLRPREGFQSVDLYAPDAQWRIDLLQMPWPWDSDSVDELHCSHFLEHIPLDVDRSGKDLLIAFMDEAWRVLKPGREFTVIVPNARSNRAFQDPTHRRFFVGETFSYFNREWREKSGLSHYLGAADFRAELRVTCPAEVAKLSDAEREARFNERWNVIWDWWAVLTKLVPPNGRTKGRRRKERGR
jgi:hypothetical protein